MGNNTVTIKEYVETLVRELNARIGSDRLRNSAYAALAALATIVSLYFILTRST